MIKAERIVVQWGDNGDYFTIVVKGNGVMMKMDLFSALVKFYQKLHETAINDYWSQ